MATQDVEMEFGATKVKVDAKLGDLLKGLHEERQRLIEELEARDHQLETERARAEQAEKRAVNNGEPIRGLSSEKARAFAEELRSSKTSRELAEAWRKAANACMEELDKGLEGARVRLTEVSTRDIIIGGVAAAAVVAGTSFVAYRFGREQGEISMLDARIFEIEPSERAA